MCLPLALLIAITLHGQDLPWVVSSNMVSVLRSFRSGNLDQARLFQVTRDELLRAPANGHGDASAAASNYLAAAQLLAPIRGRALVVAARSLGIATGTARVNPWAGPEQEPDWWPDWTEIGITNLPGVTKPLPAGVVGRWIPARYRLAELLGLGSNHIHASVLLVDPALETSSNPRYFVESRIRYTVVGTFHRTGVLRSDGPSRTVASALPVLRETFRRELDSIRRVTSLQIHAGPDVRPERTGDVEFEFDLMDSGRYAGWLNDAVVDRLADHSWSLEESESRRQQAEPAERALTDAINARLFEWSSACQTEFLRLAEAEGVARRLKSSRSTLLSAEQEPDGSRSGCLFPRFADSLPDLEALARPWEFARLSRQVRLTELHALVHRIEHQHRDSASLAVLAIAVALSTEADAKGSP